MEVNTEIQALLDITDRSTRIKFARLCGATPWLSAHAYYCRIEDFATKDKRRMRDKKGQLDDEGEAVLAMEIAALHEAVLPPVQSLDQMASRLQLLQVMCDNQCGCW